MTCWPADATTTRLTGRKLSASWKYARGCANVVRENRTFITRAITWAAGQGTRQYLDLGTGMPIRPAAGDAARAVIPDARIAYIDHDPFVTMHAEVLLADDEGIAVSDADLTDPASVLARPEVRAVIDPAEPVCLVLGLVLGFMPVRQACDVVAGYADLVAPGSCVVISCARCDDEVLWKELSEAYTDAGLVQPRTRGDHGVP